jgi:hypothetical protein
MRMLTHLLTKPHNLGVIYEMEHLATPLDDTTELSTSTCIWLCKRCPNLLAN